MKKQLLSILLMCCMVLNMLSTAAFAAGEGSADLGTTNMHCYKCDKITTFKILAYIPTPIASTNDPSRHWARAKCTNCGENWEYVPDDDSAYHTGGNETPTCTTGKTCEKCGGEYGKLGHDWGAWQSNNDNKTHTRSCQREGCNEVDTASCGGDGTATCVTQGTCTGCGGQYYGGHTFPSRWDWRSDINVGRDAEYHWVRCLHCEEGKAHMDTHSFSPGNMYLKSAATCISLPVYYMNCGTCYYKGTDTYVYQWGQLDPNNHDGGTEVKNAKAATCTEKGYTGDTHCKGCGVKLSDGKETPALDHNWGKWTANGDGTHTRVCSRDASHTETDNCSGGEASCTAKAKCADCGAEYGDTNPNHHGDKLKHVEAKDATFAAEGNIEYWHCEACGKYFSDADAKNEITQAQTVIPKRQSSGSNYSYYTIKATAGTGGSISPSGNFIVREGADQTFTIAPNKGYAVANVKIDGKSIGAVKFYTFENVRRTHTIEVIFMKVNGNPQTGVFVDVATGSYYEDAVDWAVENGITQETDNVRFSPNGVCTRAQAVTFLRRCKK